MSFVSKVKSSAAAAKGQETKKPDTKKAPEKQQEKEESQVQKKNIFESAKPELKAENGKQDKQAEKGQEKEPKGNNTEHVQNSETQRANGVTADDNYTQTQQTEEKDEPIQFGSPEKMAEKMGWSESDTETALGELQEAMAVACSNSVYDISGKFENMPVVNDVQLIDDDYSAEINGNRATVTVRGKDGFSDVEIVTPFDTSTIQSCMDIVGASGQNNGLQMVQKGNPAYSDQCFGMSAIYGSMLMDSSAYLQQTENGWQQSNDGRLQWDNDTLKGRINECGDVNNFSKVIFGGNGEDRQTAAMKMKNSIIENLQSGNPVVVEVGAIHAGCSLSRHYVTAIGYTTDEASGAPKDIVVWDPFTGDCRTLNYSYEENGSGPAAWINGYDGDRVPVTGRDVGKTASSDNPDEFQIFVWRNKESDDFQKI